MGIRKLGPDPRYDDLFKGTFGSSGSAISVANDPLALLFNFMPAKLWIQVAVENNCYHAQFVTLRARAIRAQQRGTVAILEDLSEIRRWLANVKNIDPWEAPRVVTLLITRMLAPIKNVIAAHRSTKKFGALPTNPFGVYMSKSRFFHTMGYLHFSNNKSSQALTDRAQKIRPVVTVLQRTFARGYKPPPPPRFKFR